MAEVTLSTNEFRALSSDKRVQIIKLLKERNHTLTEISKKLKLSSPTIKQHLEMLVESDLIELRDEGRKWKYYSLTRKGKNLLEPDTTNILVLVASSGIALIAVIALFAGFFGGIAPSQTPASAGEMLPLSEFGVAPTAGEAMEKTPDEVPSEATPLDETPPDAGPADGETEKEPETGSGGTDGGGMPPCGSAGSGMKTSDANRSEGTGDENCMETEDANSSSEFKEETGDTGRELRKNMETGSGGQGETTLETKRERIPLYSGMRDSEGKGESGKFPFWGATALLSSAVFFSLAAGFMLGRTGKIRVK